MSDTSSPTPPPRRRRWPRRILLGLVIVLVLLAAAPLYVGPLLAGRIEAELSERLGARVALESARFAWPARLALHELEITDEGGAPLASFDDLVASLALRPLLSGELEAEVDLVYPELHLARAADGRWNWERPFARMTAGDSDARPASKDDERLPVVRARVTVRDGHVVVHGREGDTTLSEIGLALAVDGLERPARYELALGLRGPTGPAGKLALSGSVTLAPNGRLEPAELAGEARLALEDLQLAALEPAFALLAPAEGLAGELAGQAAFTLAPGFALRGELELALSGLELHGPLAPETPARIETLTLVGEAAQDGEGRGTQRLELRADSFLSLDYAGTSHLPAAGAGELSGRLALAGDLARLSELARGWAPLLPGVSLSGRLGHELELAATFDARAPLAARLHARGGLEGLAARDAKGRALDLRELAELAFELEGRADLAQGTLALESAALRAGPLQATGTVEVAGLTLDAARRAPELRAGALRVSADLEALRGTLRQILALDERAFGGRLELSASLARTGNTLELTAETEASALAIAGVRLASLVGELRGQRADAGALSATGTLRLGALALESATRAPLALPPTQLELALAEDPSGRGTHAVELGTEDGALTLALNAKSTRTPSETNGPLALDGTYRLTGDVARLAELAAPVAPLRAGLSGALTAEGELHARLAASALEQAGGRLQLVLSGLSARDADGAPLALEALARTTLTLAGELDARSGQAELGTFALEAGGVALRGSGRLRGLAPAAPGAAAPPLELEDATLHLEADLERLGRELARVVDLGGWTVAGSPLTAELRLAAQATRLEANGTLAAARLVLQPAEGAPRALAELGLDFDLGYDIGTHSLHVRRAALRSLTATAELAGTLNELATPDAARGAMQLRLDARLERLLADLGLEPPEAGRRTSGALTLRAQLEGDRGSFRVGAEANVAEFRLEIAPATEGAAPRVVAEPRIALTADARLALGALDLELDKLELDSGLARGGARGRIENLRALLAPEAGDVRFVGLAGQLAYVPERLGAVLAPWLPGRWVGATEERATFVLDGHARELDLAALLAGASARVDLGLGRFERPEIQLDGALVLEAKEEKLLVRGDLGANGGTMQLDGTLDLARASAAPRSTLKVSARELAANAGLAPLLALVHPAFGSTPGALEGLLGLELDLAYDGPLSLEMLAAGWQTLPKQPISGSGRLELRSAALRGAPLFALLAPLGIDATRALDLKPIEFTIQKGRVSYARPWTWTLSGTETTFTGSLGLDQSLDLAWNLPITPRLLERYPFLASLAGQSLSVPLRGTVTKPRLELDGLLSDLAAKAAQAELGNLLRGKSSSGEDAETVLARADELWSQGEKVEAAALYMRLREEFKRTLTYALNKDRIRDRSKYTPPPK